MNVTVGEKMIDQVRESLRTAVPGELIPIKEMGGHFALRADEPTIRDGYDHLCSIEVDGTTVQVYLQR